MLHYGDWLSPDLAGRPFHEPPLYYWTAALTGEGDDMLEAFARVLPILLLVGLGAEKSFDEKAYREAVATAMRALKALCMPGTLALLVCGATPERTRQVQANLFHAASRYLAMPVRAIVAELGATGPGDMGKVMAAAKAALGNTAEMSAVSAAVKAALAK